MCEICVDPYASVVNISSVLIIFVKTKLSQNQMIINRIFAARNGFGRLKILK